MYWIRAWMTVGQNLMLLLGTLSHKGYPHNLAKLLDIVFALWGFLIYFCGLELCVQADQHSGTKFLEPGNVTGSVLLDEWHHCPFSASRSWKQIETRPHLPPALTPSWAEGCRVLCSFPNLLCKQKAEPTTMGTHCGFERVPNRCYFHGIEPSE